MTPWSPTTPLSNGRVRELLAMSTVQEGSSVWLWAMAGCVVWAATFVVVLHPPLVSRSYMEATVCSRKGCGRVARMRSKYCIRHGGGPMCRRDGCPKVARPSSRFCAAHGGGKRCDTDGCSRLAQGSTANCVTHGGGCRCAHQGCTRGSRGMSGLCRKHTTIYKLAKETSEEMMRIARRDHQDQLWESYCGCHSHSVQECTSQQAVQACTRSQRALISTILTQLHKWVLISCRLRYQTCHFCSFLCETSQATAQSRLPCLHCQCKRPSMFSAPSRAQAKATH